MLYGVCLLVVVVLFCFCWGFLCVFLSKSLLNVTVFGGKICVIFVFPYISAMSMSIRFNVHIQSKLL